MERKIGEIFEYDGIKLRVEKTKAIGRCDGCYFEPCLHSCAESIPVRGLCVDVTKNTDVIFKKVEDMEERTIKLTLEKAKEFYKKGGELRDLALLAYTENEIVPLPKTWEEYCKICNIESAYNEQQYNKIFIPANKQFRDTHIALMKLHQLRDYYRKGWEPNWNDNNFVKYSIVKQKNIPTVVSLWKIPSFLSFQTREIAEQFLKNFKDLIEQAGDLI